jgi:hypothetical protein|tara:strand:- start:254 stop:478 length:225 start_codon:yes stop_codon:yes gene_type:complete
MNSEEINLRRKQKILNRKIVSIYNKRRKVAQSYGKRKTMEELNLLNKYNVEADECVLEMKRLETEYMKKRVAYK